METGQQLDSILSARFATSEANQEISLYTGRVVIHTENKSLAHEGQITLRWLPPSNAVDGICPNETV